MCTEVKCQSTSRLERSECPQEVSRPLDARCLFSVPSAQHNYIAAIRSEDLDCLRRYLRAELEDEVDNAAHISNLSDPLNSSYIN